MRFYTLALYSAVITTSTFVDSVASTDHFKDALDDMERHYNGKDAEFDGAFYNDLVDCFNKFDDDILHKSQIASYKGFKDYWLTHKHNKDYLGNPDPWGQHSPFREYYERPHEKFGRYGILTCEPCNYVSNVAYYH